MVEEEREMLSTADRDREAAGFALEEDGADAADDVAALEVAVVPLAGWRDVEAAPFAIVPRVVLLVVAGAAVLADVVVRELAW